MKQIQHTLYPVSYIDDEGNQQDTLWSWTPAGDSYWVGEQVTITVDHVDGMGDDARLAKIADLKAQVERLEGLS